MISAVAAGILPGPQWAQPVGWHHRLIIAAIHPDDAVAMWHARAWLGGHDIDVVTFREHRLLAAIIVRFGRRLADLDSYPRLVGLQRMLWTRTMMSLREAAPALSAMVAAGVPVMVIKGAARMADGGDSARGRVAHDIDIVVRPSHMAGAFAILVEGGWTPASGASVLSLAAGIGQVRGMNLFRGSFGDIDLHSLAFHPVHGSAIDDDGLWSRAQKRVLSGVDVLVPSAEDRLAISVGHGGLDAHAHADWLVDMAVTLTSMPVDYGVLAGLIERRRLSCPALVAFDYLKSNGDFGIADGFLDQLRTWSLSRPFRSLGELLEARPRDRSGPVLHGLRWLAKQMRKARGGPSTTEKAPQPRLAVHRSHRTAAASAADAAQRLNWDIEIPPDLSGAAWLRIRLQVRLATPAVRRRIEFEVNTPTAHLARGRFRNLWRFEKLDLRISADFGIQPGTEKLILSSRPGRHLRPCAGSDDVAAYGALPFTLISAAVTAVQPGRE
ncbi:putative nucleotidyltransferase-like protein [Hoeflea marina]|uniref:Putative nucleotidyltransferase-like protein n=1 Tax=Hoeflea marina TaxID=274592 RepID=A0A317PTV2_9HYPH|nr:nucleotidyltransferase family protein [Hoeflea marina]PWW04094.1 putative nucleotidyltransferase-like protein [Hoeflea marina]